MKSTVNALKEENLKLKTRINNLEKEASKFEKMVMQKATQMENTRGDKSLSEVLFKERLRYIKSMNFIDLSHDNAETADQRRSQ